MRFFIADDDENIVMILKNVIKNLGLGEIIGAAHDGDTAVRDILCMRPDIVLIDYLMPKMDGAAVVDQVRRADGSIHFIMLSQVSDSNMISDAYNNGIEFYIHKPINKVEVERVVQSMVEKIEVLQKFETLKSLLIADVPAKTQNRKKKSDDGQLKRIQIILSEIGIVGSKGAGDILRVCQHRIENRDHDTPLSEICTALNENSKIMMQRMRRAIAIGLRNLAHMGIEDNLNDSFLRYSSTLYYFEDIRNEMEMLRGRADFGGRVHVDKFIENLLLIAEQD